MRKIKEVLLTIVSFATIIACGIGCVSVVSYYFPKYELIGVPMMLYAWFLAGKGFLAFGKQLDDKWDAEEKRIAQYKARKEKTDD